jgi:hypothetical protein
MGSARAGSARRAEVEVTLTVNGQPANVLRVNFK